MFPEWYFLSVVYVNSSCFTYRKRRPKVLVMGMKIREENPQ